MDDTACREFFSQTTNPYHRRYEALRAVFVEGRSQKEVAEEFGYQYGSLRQLVYEFREHCRADSDGAEPSPFFESWKSDDRPARKRGTRSRKRPQSPTAGS